MRAVAGDSGMAAWQRWWQGRQKEAAVREEGEEGTIGSDWAVAEGVVGSGCGYDYDEATGSRLRTVVVATGDSGSRVKAEGWAATYVGRKVGEDWDRGRHDCVGCSDDKGDDNMGATDVTWLGGSNKLLEKAAAR
ncbi:hypothetical protein BHE74_00023188 [Ensete ventricosum]|nr:hypothetical protein GW17_00015644 [Ensete ventricosum]RWW69227.1 hypothetical protein BHE74_00023188 [Ensete ventricosum]RZS02307.1 hypothetical protein BHM03_00032348 [Ensete ventricosum]